MSDSGLNNGYIEELEIDIGPNSFPTKAETVYAETYKDALNSLEKNKLQEKYAGMMNRLTNKINTPKSLTYLLTTFTTEPLINVSYSNTPAAKLDAKLIQDYNTSRLVAGEILTRLRNKPNSYTSIRNLLQTNQKVRNTLFKGIILQCLYGKYCADYYQSKLSEFSQSITERVKKIVSDLQTKKIQYVNTEKEILSGFVSKALQQSRPDRDFLKKRNFLLEKVKDTIMKMCWHQGASYSKDDLNVLISTIEKQLGKFSKDLKKTQNASQEKVNELANSISSSVVDLFKPAINTKISIPKITFYPKTAYKLLYPEGSAGCYDIDNNEIAISFNLQQTLEVQRPELSRCLIHEYLHSLFSNITNTLTREVNELTKNRKILEKTTSEKKQNVIHLHDACLCLIEAVNECISLDIALKIPKRYELAYKKEVDTLLRLTETFHVPLYYFINAAYSQDGMQALYNQLKTAGIRGKNGLDRLMNFAMILNKSSNPKT